MKKTILAALVLLLCCLCLPALAVEYNAGGIYTVRYDESTYRIDDTAYLNENTDEYSWLFMLYNSTEDIFIDAAMEVIPEFEGITLFSADAQGRSDYLAATLDAFADQDIQYLTTITAGEWQIPFYVYSMTDEDGSFLYAETIVNGCAIHFNANHPNSSELSDALLPALEELLLTFAPVVPGE